MWVETEHKELSVRRQCGLLGINRSSLYYRPAGVDDFTLKLMHELDKQYTETPFYGVLKMTEHLRSLGHLVNPKRVRRLLRKMGLDAVYPKPRLSLKSGDYPHLTVIYTNLRE